MLCVSQCVNKVQLISMVMTCILLALSVFVIMDSCSEYNLVPHVQSCSNYVIIQVCETSATRN